MRLIGVEPLTLPHETQLARILDVRGIDSFLKSPWQTIVSPETLLDLGEAEGATPVTGSGQTLPPIKALADVPAGLLIVDIGLAQVLLERPERLSRLIISARMGIAAPPLAMVVGDELRLVERLPFPETEIGKKRAETGPRNPRQRTQMPEIAGQRPEPASLTPGNVDDFRPWAKYTPVMFGKQAIFPSRGMTCGQYGFKFCRLFRRLWSFPPDC